MNDIRPISVCFFLNDQGNDDLTELTRSVCSAGTKRYRPPSPSQRDQILIDTVPPLQIARQVGKVDILSSKFIQSQVENEAIQKSFQSHMDFSLNSSPAEKETIENLSQENKLLRLQLDLATTEPEKTTLGEDAAHTSLESDDPTDESQGNKNKLVDSQGSTQESMQVDSMNSIPEQQDIKFSTSGDNWVVEGKDNEGNNNGAISKRVVCKNSVPKLSEETENIFAKEAARSKSESLLVDFGETETRRPRRMRRWSSLIGLNKYAFTEKNQDDLPIDSLQLSTQESMQVKSRHAIPELQDIKFSTSGDDWIIEGEDIEVNNNGANSERAARRNSMPISSKETKNASAKGAARRESEGLLVDFGETETRRPRITRRLSWCNLIGLNQYSSTEKNQEQEDLPINSLQLSTQESMQVKSMHSIPELQDIKFSTSGDDWIIEGEDIEANENDADSKRAARRNFLQETKNAFAKGAARSQSEGLLVDFG